MKPSTRNFFLYSLVASGVLSPPVLHASGVEVAGGLVVDLRADHPTAGTATWDNLATSNTSEDFNLFSGGDPIKTTINGVDFVRLDPDDNYVGPDAPSSMTGAGPRSIEVWVKNDAVANEEVMVAWGKRGAEPRNYAFSYGTNNTWGALGGWGSGDVPWYATGAGAPAPALLHHLVITYDGTTTRLYSDGVLTNSRVHTLDTYNDPNKIIINGAWEGDNSTVQRPNSGEMDYSVIRVHTGVLSDAQVLSNYQAGWSSSAVSGPKWTGTTSDWGTAANWNPSGVPTAAQAVVFGSAGSSATVNLGAARTQAGLGFDAAVGTTINGGGFTLTLGNGAAFAPVEASGTHAISAPLALSSAVKFDVVGSTSTVSLGGGISGSQDLIKIGAGSLNLSGTNTHTGNLYVDGGSLKVNGGSVTSAVTVRNSGILSGTGNSTLTATAASGGTVAPGGSGTVGSTAMKSLTMNTGSLLDIDFGTGNDTLAITSALTLNSGGVRLLAAGTSTAFATNGTYTVATYGSLVGSVSNLFVANPAAGHSYSFSVSGNSLLVTVGSSSVWNGGGNPSTQWSNALNWSGVAVTNGSRLEFASAPTAPASVNNITGGSYQGFIFGAAAPSYQLTGNALTLTGDATGTIITNDSAALQTIALPAQITASSAVAANGAAVSITGALSGSGALVKKGSKLVTLSGTNTFGGGVTVQPGNAIIGDDATLIGLGSASALGSGPLTLAFAGVTNATASPLVLSTTNAQTWSGDVTFSGPELNMGSSAVTLADTTRLKITNALTIGSLTGASRLELDSGTLSLTATGGAGLQELLLNGGFLKLVSGTPSLTLTGYEGVKLRGVTSAHMEMSTGTLNLPGRFRIGNDYEFGSASITGGTINHTDGDLDLGFNGGQANLTFGGNVVYNGSGRLLQMGTAWQSRTTLTIKDSANVTTGDVWVGGSNLVPATYNLASLTVKDSATMAINGILFIGREAGAFMDAQFNQLGGSTVVSGTVKLAGDAVLSTGPDTNANLNLVGGSFSTMAVDDYSGDSVLSFQGGSLTITEGDSPRITADHIYLYQDAKITTVSGDTGLFGALENPTDSGVSSVAITQAGSGYQLVPPMVRFSGTSGNGATGLAIVDPTTGAVTGVTITCPGSGYLAGQEPTVELLGGSGTGAVPGAVTLASNAGYSGGLVKSGAGMLTAIVPVTYRGDTTVQAGTLILLDNSLNDTSSVRLTTGATLDLQTFGAVDTVKRLFIDGAQQTSGTWGAIGSGAQHETASITGDGRLMVTEAGTGATPFQTWISTQAFGLAVADRDPGDDPDRDGVTNIQEFAFKGSPSSGASTGMTAMLIQDSNASGTKELTLVAAVRRGTSFSAGANGSLVGTLDGVTYTVSGSQSLQLFDKQVSVVGAGSNTPPAGVSFPSLSGENWEYRVFKLDVSEGLLGKGFLRIQAQ